MKIVNVKKAQSFDRQLVEDVTIQIHNELQPIATNEANWREDMRMHFEMDAKAVHSALEALPGGTYDALLGLMLKKKASHFVIAHAFDE
jgi:hypothetical protein